MKEEEEMLMLKEEEMMKDPWTRWLASTSDLKSLGSKESTQTYIAYIVDQGRRYRNGCPGCPEGSEACTESWMSFWLAGVVPDNVRTNVDILAAIRRSDYGSSISLPEVTTLKDARQQDIRVGDVVCLSTDDDDWYVVRRLHCSGTIVYSDAKNHHDGHAAAHHVLVVDDAWETSARRIEAAAGGYDLKLRRNATGWIRVLSRSGFETNIRERDLSSMSECTSSDSSELSSEPWAQDPPEDTQEELQEELQEEPQEPQEELQEDPQEELQEEPQEDSGCHAFRKGMVFHFTDPDFTDTERDPAAKYVICSTQVRHGKRLICFAPSVNGPLRFVDPTGRSKKDALQIVSLEDGAVLRKGKGGRGWWYIYKDGIEVCMRRPVAPTPKLKKLTRLSHDQRKRKRDQLDEEAGDQEREKDDVESNESRTREVRRLASRIKVASPRLKNGDWVTVTGNPLAGASAEKKAMDWRTHNDSITTVHGDFRIFVLVYEVGYCSRDGNTTITLLDSRGTLVSGGACVGTVHADLLRKVSRDHAFEISQNSLYGYDEWKEWCRIRNAVH